MINERGAISGTKSIIAESLSRKATKSTKKSFVPFVPLWEIKGC